MPSASDSTPRGLLARWYGDPLDSGRARRLLVEAENRRQRRARRGIGCRVCLLQMLLAHYWLNGELEAEYLRLRPRFAGTGRGTLLLEQIAGQLMMARRLTGAFGRLERAFRDGHRLYRSDDYFRVMKRLELLRQLPLSDHPLAAADLKDLLTTARVIQRLQGEQQRPAVTADPNDIYG